MRYSMAARRIPFLDLYAGCVIRSGPLGAMPTGDAHHDPHGFAKPVYRFAGRAAYTIEKA
jgi:hypothetical protein